jgi:hypothetical protein
LVKILVFKCRILILRERREERENKKKEISVTLSFDDDTFIIIRKILI